nr:hypothetical protein [Tanacetum cinerariifolium]
MMMNNDALYGPVKKKLHCVKLGFKSYPITSRQTYDMVNEELKTVRPNVAQLCGVYHNVTRRVVSRAEDRDYTQKALLEYKAEYGIPFTLLYVWAKLRRVFEMEGGGASKL